MMALKSMFGSKVIPSVALLILGSVLFVMNAPLVAGGLMVLSVVLTLALYQLRLNALRRRVVTALVALGLVVLSFGLLPVDSSILLPLFLGIAGWLKLAEHSGPRDRFVAALAGLWLIALELLHLTPNAALSIIALSLVCLIAVLARDVVAPVRGRGRFGWAVTALPAAVLAMLFFVFTPRITGDLNILAFALDLPFVIETDDEAAREPPSEDMALEEFQQKQEDMRVLVADFSNGSGPFEKTAPPVNELYWRGPVFWTYETGRWRVRPGFERRSPRMATKLTGEKLEAQIREATKISMYDVTIFPHRSEWLYALDIPAFTPPSGYITEDWQLMNLNPVRELLSYKMMAFVEYRAGVNPDAKTIELGLQLPVNEEPRTVALGRRLQQEHGPDPVDIARAGRAHFAQGFTHNRRAVPIVGDNQIDSFMFETREGYGMHFATAYALMMRAAGIPARVVSGYHGGLYMFLIERVYVTEADSHAWVEIWLDDYGWVRMDVARASMDMQAVDGLPKAEAQGVVEVDGEAPRDEDDQTSDPETNADTGEQGHWLSGFDAQTQSRLLSATGLEANAGALALSGVLVVVILVVLSTIWRLVRGFLRRRRLPAVVQLTQRFSHKLGRLGSHRRPSEGLHAYVARALSEVSADEKQAAEISAAADWLCQVRYGQNVVPVPVGISSISRVKNLVRQIVRNS